MLKTRGTLEYTLCLVLRKLSCSEIPIGPAQLIGWDNAPVHHVMSFCLDNILNNYFEAEVEQ